MINKTLFADDSMVKKLSLLYSCMIVFAYYYLFYSVTGQSSNIIFYFGSIALFIVVYIFSNYIFSHLKNKSLYVITIGTTVVFCLFSFMWAINTYNCEPFRNTKTYSSYFRHSIEPWMYFLVLSVAAACFVCMRKIKRTSFRLPHKLLLSFVVATVQSWFLYEPNFLYDTEGGAYHIEAYANSIINCIHGQPFSEINSSIYGKYALFYYLPVKMVRNIVDNEWLAVVLVISVFGWITFFVQNIILCELISDDLLLVVSLLATGIPVFQIFQGAFYQVYPHRVLFQVIVIYCCILQIKRKEKRFALLIDAVIVLALLWNIEIGIVSALTWGICRFYLYALDSDNKKSKSIIGKMVCIGIIKILLSIVIAFVIYNICNYLLGGDFQSIKSFFYPIVSDKSYSMVEIGLEKPWAEYFLCITVFLGVICYGIKDYLFGKINYKSLVAFLIAIEGLGCMVYFMNRPQVTYISIVVFELIALGAYICERSCKNNAEIIENTVDKPLNILDRGINVLSSLMIVSIFLASIFQMPINYLYVKDYGHNKVFIDEYTARLNVLLPADTVAYGFFVEPLFSYMNKDCRIYVEDFEDFGVWTEYDVAALIDEELAKTNPEYILVGDREDIYIPDGYVDIYSNKIDVGYGVNYRLLTRDDIDIKYYNVANLIFTSGVILSIDNIHRISESINIEESDSIDELWNILQGTNLVSDDMDDDAYIAFLYSSMLSRKVNEDEYVACMQMLDGGMSKKELLLNIISNEQYNTEAIERYNIICQSFS